MRTRIYKLEELSESMDILESDPPGWLQFLLFALLLGLLVAGSWAGKELNRRFGQDHGAQVSKGQRKG